MIPTIQFHSGSWPSTKSCGDAGNISKSSTSSAPAKVYNFEQRRFKPVAAPIGYRAIEDVVTGSERNPRRKAALERARAKIADTLQHDQGETVRTARLRLGWSQAKLSAMLGTSQPHVARIERGSENVAWETMKKLCHALQVDMNAMDEMLTRQRHIFESSQR